MSTSRKPAWSGPSKKISSWVRPGVCEVRASALRPVSALIRLDLPTLERPAKATSMPAIGGSVSIEGEAQKNCQSPANSFRPCSISFASGSVVMRRFPISSSCPGLSRASTPCCVNEKEDVDGRDKPGRDEFDISRPAPSVGVRSSIRPSSEPNVALRLSNSSTFTPLRRMMKLCCSTDSVLFQAQ